MTRLLTAPTPAQVAEFWAETTARGTPLVEPHDAGSVRVTFLWRGRAATTRAWWGVDVPLDRLPGTDLWHGSRVLPADLRTTYCLVHGEPSGAPTDTTGRGDTHLDLANPMRVTFPADPADPDDYDSFLSLLELPDAPAEPWTGPRPGVPSGTVTDVTLPGGALGGPRPAAVYRPAGTPAKGLPVLVVFDGYLARRVLRVPTVLDNLIAAGRIPPTVALFVSSLVASRDDDLRPAAPIVDFLTHELMPWARDHLGAGADGRANTIAGASRGGLAATWAGLAAPELFGAVVAQSGSFWWPSPDEGEPGWLIREAARRPRRGTRFYLDVGVRETMPGPGGAPDQLTVVRQMRDALTAAGHEVQYAEFNGGHDYVNWRRTFAEGLIAVSGVRC
jgi:enterochelin esterase-like enzyme